jgi:hypothetical protein
VGAVEAVGAAVGVGAVGASRVGAVGVKSRMLENSVPTVFALGTLLFVLELSVLQPVGVVVVCDVGLEAVGVGAIGVGAVGAVGAIWFSRVTIIRTKFPVLGKIKN